MKSNNYIRFGSHNFMRAQFLLFLTFISFAASAKTYTDPTYNVVYTLNESAKTATVAAENASLHKSNASAIVIPATITDTDGTEYRVSSIVSGAFKETAITSIDIQARVGSLPDKFFQNCKNLVTVNLPPTITSIPEYAFQNCEKLTTLNFDNITKISGYAFQGCNSLPCPNFENIQSVGYNAFKNCGALGDVVIPLGTLFSSYCFDGANISTLNFIDSDNPQPFGSSLFLQVKGLEYVKFPGFMKTLPGFNSAADLKSVDLSELDENFDIPQGCFNSCKLLETVIFPKKIKSIGETAFSGTGIKKSRTSATPGDR